MKISKILVPISRPDYVEEMMEVACRLAKAYKARIYALYVIEMPRSLPLEAEIAEETEEGETVLSKAEGIAEDDYEMEITTDLLQARTAGLAILQEALEQKVDLILMEAAQKRSLEERIFGSTVDYILKKAPCMVWVIRPASSGSK